MEQRDPIINTGLRGVTIASTRISDVDGQAGKLIYRGYLVQDLAERATFEEVCYLLLYEKLPGADELKEFKARLLSERQVKPEVIAALRRQPPNALPMDILQAGVSMLANYDPDITEMSREASLRVAIRLIARLPIVLAAWERIRTGKEVVESSPDLDHAANFLFLLKGEAPDAEVAHYLDAALVLHAEHSFNASTFAAREIASTRAHMYAAIAGAVGSLSGELHGGANVRVMQMLQKIGSADAIEGFVKAELEAGRKIFGLGHAVYKTDDPRAHILAPMSEKMGQRIGQPQWYEMSRILEQKGKAAFKAHKGIEIYTNVDFYSASLYYAMGIPLDYFTPVFAIARIAGWTAHVIEEQFAGAAEKPTLYRPESDYIGDYCGPEECAFVPIENR
ncbi:MAG: citrate/2-methylcitrate synthase [Desulfobacterales bacterium]|jgi:citrate synthase